MSPNNLCVVDINALYYLLSLVRMYFENVVKNGLLLYNLISLGFFLLAIRP